MKWRGAKTFRRQKDTGNSPLQWRGANSREANSPRRQPQDKKNLLNTIPLPNLPCGHLQSRGLG